MFEYSLWASVIYSILDLKNEEKTYLFCFIGIIEETAYLSFQKFQFLSADISQPNSFIKKSYSPRTEDYHVRSSITLSCFEISKYEVIQSFYLDFNGIYTIGLFNENNLEFIDSIFIDKGPEGFSMNERVELYYQSINLKNEISILAYMPNKIPDCIYLQMKNVVYNKYLKKYDIEDYLLNYQKFELKNENIFFNSFFYMSHLNKINSNKFSLISASKLESFSLKIYELFIILFDIYNFHDTDLFVRYYHVPLKLYGFWLYRYVLSINYNNFLGLVYTIDRSGSYYQQFSIFSYINSTDSSLINLGSGTILKLSDYINKDNLENNVFGVDFYGVKILKLPSTSEIGFYFFSNLKQNLIYENEILSPEDEIYFIYDYASLKKGEDKYTIEMAGIVQEKEYNDAISYTIKHSFYGDSSAQMFYKRKILMGRTSFYNYTIPNGITGTNDGSCIDNCKVCYRGICIKCKDNYNLIEEQNICQNTFNDEGYFYDNNYKRYRKCHQNCKSCLMGPKYYSDALEIEDSNCDKCIDNYYKIENTNNCINKGNIPESYYFDDNRKLIGKCFENCKTCNQNKTNSSYYGCLSCDQLSILYEKSANCLNCKLRGKYAAHYENECIDFIPEGYYLEDENDKAIAKCYFSCKNCSEGGDKDNHKCIECGEDYLYRNKERTKCLPNCSEEYLYTDLQTKMCYNDCIDNIVTERIYNFENICISLEDKPEDYELVGVNNLVKKCNNLTGYFFNDECYRSCPNNTIVQDINSIPKICICNNLFYLTGKNLTCINGEECPNEYPFLKPGTKECSKCLFLYNGNCYSSCPKNTYINQTIADLKTR